MKKGDIKLSPKHGVNPAIPLCFYCNEAKNEVILAGRLPGDEEAPRASVWDTVPCDKCKGYMAKGVILISVKDGSEGDNPYRTGGWVVVKDEFITRAIDPVAGAVILKRRASFVPDEVWDRIGLPRGPMEGVPSE